MPSSTRWKTLSRAILWVAVLASAPLRAASPDIVISQIYGGGGNAGATLTNDFIEVFNRGTAPVSVNGWSVQYAAAAGTSWQRTNLPNLVLAPGQYLLVQESQGAGGTQPPPTPDAIGNIAMAATSGKVALLTNTTLLTCGTSADCLANPAVHDFVGFGSSASAFEGAAPTPTLTNTTAALRANHGCTDTDQNSADFASGAPTPRNSAAPLAPCGVAVNQPVATSCPASFATLFGDAGTATLHATDPDGTVIAAAIVSASVSGIALGAFSASASAGAPASANLEISPGTAIGTYTVQVQFSNSDTTPQAAVCSVLVTVASPTPTARIHDIQGAAHISPLNGQTVSNVPGVVTALRSNGFYMQDPAPDADPATSEGIFVFTSSAPTVLVGDSVRVSGKVSEFRAGGADGFENLTNTEIVNPVTIILSQGNPLPAPVIVGIGGRIPPSQAIDSGNCGSVEESACTFDPATDGIDFWESLEGMRVQINNALATGPTNSFGETSVVADLGANAGPRTTRGGVRIVPGDFNPERLFLDNEIVPLPKVSLGDSFPLVIGVMDYSFGNFKLQVTEAAPVLSGGLAPETTTAQAANQLAVASFNVENLAPGNPPAKFATLAGQIVHNLQSPDVVALMEIQDNNGATSNGVVDADVTIGLLISAIQAAGGPVYQFRSINPVDGQDGGEPGGNIRQGFLFNPARVAFVDRPGGTPTAATAVVAGASGSPELTFSPGRIDPANPAFNSSRKPLAGEFSFNGHRLFLIANHFNSKGGDQPLFGRFQPPALVSEAQRSQQAEVVRGFVQSILALDANAKVVVLGDLNDFEFSAPVGILKSAPLNDLVETLAPEERYTYVFEGNSQVLDHVLVSNSLMPGVEYDVVHVNSEFAVQASDHEPEVARLLLPPADHVPPTTAASATPAPNANGWNNTPVTVTLSASDDRSGVASISYSAVTVSPAGTILSGGSVAGATAIFVVSDQGTTTLTYRATDNAGNVEADHVLTLRIDTTAPLLALPGGVTANATSPSGAVVSYAASATDNSGLTPIVSCAPASGSSFAIGATKVSCSATDAAGNASSGSFSVTVNGPLAQAASLIALVESFNLERNVRRKLVEIAQKAIEDLAEGGGKIRNGCKSLDKFGKEAGKEAGDGLTPAQAHRLIADADRIQAAQGCQ